MKIGEAQGIYRDQVRAYQKEKNNISKQLQNLRKRKESRPEEKEGFQSSGLRRVGIRYFSALIRLLTGKRVTDPTSGMRMVNRDVMELYARSYPKDYPEPESVTAILRMGKKVTEIPVVMKKREEGTSSIGGVKSVYYMIKVTLAVLMERLRG